MKQSQRIEEMQEESEQWKVVNRSSDGVDDWYLGWDIEGPESSGSGRGQFARGDDARIICAAVNSYRRQCADPLAAAEADLLGEALDTLREAQMWISLLDEFGSEEAANWAAILMDVGAEIDQVLALADTSRCSDQ
jgi:hypothetical protein